MKTVKRAAYSSVFAELYPIVPTYVTERCFGRTVDIDSASVRSQDFNQPMLLWPRKR